MRPLLPYLLHPRFPSAKACRILGLARDLAAVEAAARKEGWPAVPVPEAVRSLARWAEEGLALVLWGAEGYPEPLSRIADPPPVLFVRGGMDASLALAVVGSRRPRPESLEFARHLASSLARRGVAVVSGLARGVDSAAHRGALEAGGATWAVLGSGHGRIYPPEHRPLAAEIAASGGVVSEYPPDTPPHASRFPARNRIIAGLCRGVVLVEAAARSGSLITARMALEEGRDLFVAPGGVLDERFVGSNFLIKQGAKLVQCAEDVLEEYPEAGPPPAGTPAAPPVEGTEAVVLAALAVDRPRIADDLARALGLSMADLSAALTGLELKGLALRQPGGAWTRTLR
jgi:DNA processing protein